MVRAAVLAVGCIAGAAAFAPTLSTLGSVRPLSGHTALKASVATESGRWQPPMGYVPARLSKSKEVGESQAQGATAQALNNLETSLNNLEESMAPDSKKSAPVATKLDSGVLRRTLTIRTPWGAMLLLLKREPDFLSAQEVEEKVHSVGLLFKLAVKAMASLPGNMVQQVLRTFPLRISAGDAASAATTAVAFPDVQLYWGGSSLGSARQLVRGVISPMSNFPREVVKQVLRPLPLNFSPAVSTAASITGNLVNRAKTMMASKRKALRPAKVSTMGDEDYLSSLSLSTNTKKRWQTPQGGYVPTSKRQADWSTAYA
jgi:hypothetical protein